MATCMAWMRALHSLLGDTRSDERGASVTEYVIVVAFIAAIVAVLIGAFILKVSTFTGSITI